MHQFNQVSRTAMLLLALTATSQTVLAQSRTCIIDEVNGQHRCGWLADERGYRIADRPVYAPPAAPVVVPRPALNNDGYDPRWSIEERQAYEQKRLEIQEWVNSLFLDVLGRDADIVTLRRVSRQVMEGRHGRCPHRAGHQRRSPHRHQPNLPRHPTPRSRSNRSERPNDRFTQRPHLGADSSGDCGESRGAKPSIDDFFAINNIAY